MIDWQHYIQLKDLLEAQPDTPTRESLNQLRLDTISRLKMFVQDLRNGDIKAEIEDRDIEDLQDLPEDFQVSDYDYWLSGFYDYCDAVKIWVK